MPTSGLLAEINALVQAAGGTVAAGPVAAVTEAHSALVAKLRDTSRKAIWLGALAQRHPQYAALRAATAALAAATGASVGVLAEGGNAAGAWLAGCVPHREAGGTVATNAGRNAAQMLSASMDAYLLWDVEPWADSSQSKALQSLKGSTFVVAATPFASEEIRQVAHVLLPIGSFAETSGTYVNLEGLWQSFAGAAQPVGQSRPGWKVLRVLGNLLGFKGFEQLSSEEVRDELKATVTRSAGIQPAVTVNIAPTSDDGAAVVDVPAYQLDAILRRAGSLQRTKEGRATRAVYRSAGATP